MEQVGWRLIEVASNNILNSWGGQWGYCPGIPDTIIAPNGDIICAAKPDIEYSGVMLMPWMMEAPPPIIPIISRRQLFQQAALEDLITQAEALAAVQTGAIPAALEVAIDAMPDDGSKFSARMMLAGAANFDRSHPLTSAVAGTFNKTDAEIDTFFLAASQI